MQGQTCVRLARLDQIDELEDEVGDIKWSSVKDKKQSEKLDYWNSQYATLTSEQAKMKILVKQKEHIQNSNPIYPFIY